MGKGCSHWRPTEKNRAAAAPKHFLRGRVSKEICVRNLKINFTKYFLKYCPSQTPRPLNCLCWGGVMGVKGCGSEWQIPRSRLRFLDPKSTKTYVYPLVRPAVRSFGRPVAPPSSPSCPSPHPGPRCPRTWTPTTFSSPPTRRTSCRWTSLPRQGSAGAGTSCPAG